MVTRKQLAALTLTFMAVACLSGEILAGERVEVQLKNGRTFSGSVHATSNSSSLRIESHGVSAKMVRSIRWQLIDSVQIKTEQGEIVLEADEARSSVMELAKSKRPVRVRSAADARFKSYAQQALELLRP